MEKMDEIEILGKIYKRDKKSEVILMTLTELKDIKLSEHFQANEIFFMSGMVTLSDNPKLQKVQFMLAESLCQNLLESIREIAQQKSENAFVTILGGCRNLKTHMKMFDTNWIAPSNTSDHSYMNDYYPLGVGAADFVIPRFDAIAMERLFDEIIEHFDPSQYGQVIFYPDSESKFIHISNPKSILRKWVR
jgi:glutaredoxin-related protein